MYVDIYSWWVLLLCSYMYSYKYLDFRCTWKRVLWWNDDWVLSVKYSWRVICWL